MANYAPSDLVAGQAKFNEKFLSGEWRMPDSAAFKTATNGSVANPMLAGLHTREDRAVTAYFPIRQAATDGTARAHDHSGARGDSLGESITWSTFSEPFSISLKQADNNVFDFAEMYAASQKNAIFNIVNRLDAWFVAQLLAAKTEINAGGGNGAYDGVTTNDYQYPSGANDFFYQNVKAMMDFNLYNGGVTAIVDSPAWVLAQKNLNQGTANSINEQFQFMGYDSIVPTTRAVLDVPTTYSASAITFESGLVGAIPWIPKQNRKALNPALALSNNGDYGFVSIPDLGIDFAIHSYAERADNSAVNGETQDLTINVELSVDLGFVPAPLGALRGANDSVIYTSGILA